MLQDEAVRIRDLLVAHGTPSPMLNLASSTRHVREIVQPHVARELFEPLAARGVEIVHSDVRAGDGIDLAGDILDADFVRSLSGRGFACLLCANLLEHVRDPAAAAAACEAIVAPGGLILATAPSSYPYHADPIDTGFRPAPAALAALFARSAPLHLEALEAGSYRDEIGRRGTNAAAELIRTAGFGLVAAVRPKSFRARVHRWLWYRRPFRVAIALLRVPGRSDPG